VDLSVSNTIGTSERLTTGRIAGLWFMFIGPLVASFLQQQLTYAMVTPACERRLPWLVHLPLIPGLLLVGLAIILARREWQRGGERPATDVGGVTAAARLFSLVGFAVSGLALALIFAQWIPTLFLDPCQR
jgi:hypothetical protein